MSAGRYLLHQAMVDPSHVAWCDLREAEAIRTPSARLLAHRRGCAERTAQVARAEHAESVRVDVPAESSTSSPVSDSTRRGAAVAARTAPAPPSLPTSRARGRRGCGRRGWSWRTRAGCRQCARRAATGRPTAGHHQRGQPTQEQGGNGAFAPAPRRRRRAAACRRSRARTARPAASSACRGCPGAGGGGPSP